MLMQVKSYNFRFTENAYQSVFHLLISDILIVMKHGNFSISLKGWRSADYIISFYTSVVLM